MGIELTNGDILRCLRFTRTGKAKSGGELARLKSVGLVGDGGVVTGLGRELISLKESNKGDGVMLALRDFLYQRKYKHYVKGSARRTRGASKLTATIRCEDCQKTRDVFTSDLFQVKTCGDCN